MLKKTIEYTDYNGTVRKEDFYFNINEAELAELELGIAGGMSDMLTRIINSREDTEIVKVFKELILKAYGEKSPDGKYFEKSEEISKKFTSTEAYSKLFMELATNSDAAAKFVKAILPTNAESTDLTVAGNA